MNARQSILIYRDELLGESETFILAQAESFIGFNPFYVGLRRRAGLRLPEARVHIISGTGLAGKFERARFKLLGPDKALQSTLAAHRPVLLHAHFGPDGCNAVSLAQKLHLPLLVTLHGYDVTISDRLMPRLYTRRRRTLCSQAAKFICVSEFIRNRAIEKGFPAEKLSVHYTGIDTRIFEPDASITRSPIILFVGRLIAKKGCEYLIRAAARVQNVLPQVQLIVIGEGSLHQELETQAAATLKSFKFLGAQEPRVVRDWMNRAMVFCTPSVVADSGDTEGFGMVFAEAQAMGLPVVSFASGGIPEAVSHEETGFLVRERDWEDLAAKLLLVLQDNGLWRQLSESGQHRVKELFDVHQQAARLEQIYDRTIEEWRRAKVGARSGTENSLIASGPIDTDPLHSNPSSDSLALGREP